MRRVRATFLLRCVILVGSVAVFLGVLFLGLGSGWTIVTLMCVATIWVVGIEGDLLPLAIEHVVTRRAARGGKPMSSIWFVDLDRQRSRQTEGFHDDTRGNPTIR